MFAVDVNKIEINVSRISTTLIAYANSEKSDDPVKTRSLVSLYGVHIQRRIEDGSSPIRD